MYEVALSFASEQREYAEGVATALQSRGISVFYDDFEKIELWGKDLTEEFQAIFERGSDAVVFFVSKAWVEKPWPRIERRFALSRAVGEPEFDVLPVRFDDTPVPGLAESVAYICAQHYSPAELASMIAERLGVKPFEGKGLGRTASPNDLSCRRGCLRLQQPQRSLPHREARSCLRNAVEQGQ